MIGRSFSCLATAVLAILISGERDGHCQEAATQESAELAARTWTAGGGTSVRGVMLGVDGGGVRLKLEDGRVVTPPLSQLSDADRLYVSKRIASLVAGSLPRERAAAGNSLWPDRVDAAGEELEIEELGDSENRFKFRSRSFDWAADVQLPSETQRDLVRFFEGTMKLIRLMPGNLGDTSEAAGGRFKVELYETGAALSRATGTSGRGSAYLPKDQTLYCVLEGAGVTKSGTDYLRDSGHQGKLLRRDLVLMVLDRSGSKYLPAWAGYGLSDLVAAVPQVDGVFFGGRVLEKFKQSGNAKAAAFQALQRIPALDGKAWNLQAQSSPGAGKAMEQAAILLVYTLATEESAAFEKMLATAADLGPKWDDYFAKADIYRKQMAALKLRPDVEFREDGRFRLPAGEKPPVLPPAPENADPNLLPERLTAIAMGGRTAAAVADSVKEKVPAILEKSPAPVMGANAKLARSWTDVQGRSMNAALTGYDSGQVIFAKEGKPIRIPLAKLSPGDQDFVAMHIADLVDASGAAAGLGSVAVEATKRWPSKLAAPNGLTNADYDQQNSKPGRHLYRTRYFEYVVHAPHPLSPVVMKDIARVFEGTRELLSQSPWGVQAQPDDGKFQAELWETKEQYVRAGGPSNSSGVYLIKEKRFLVPFESLGLKATGSSYIKAPNYEIKTLVHELTHMMMHDIIGSLPIWMVEGTAEYTEAIPLRNYEFHCLRIEDGAKAVNKRYFELRQNPGFRGILDFAELIEMSRTNWNHKVMGTSPKPKTTSTSPFGGRVGIDLSGLIGGGMLGGQRSDPLMQAALYQSSLLLTYYFMNLDGDGKGTRVLQMLAAARMDKPKWDAYEVAFKKYEREIREFMKRPDVQTLPDGSFKYPSFLTPPKAPQTPVTVSEDGDPGLGHVDLLLDGRTPAQVAIEAKAALEKAGFILK